MTETVRKGAVQRAVEWLLGDTEPVRRALYGVLVPAVALLVAYGVLADVRAPLWIALGTAILGPAATESARAIAWSPRTAVEYGERWQEHAEAEYARGVNTALERTPEIVADEVGEHAADRYATTRANRCRSVESGRRCLLVREHRGPHLTT